MTVRKPNTPMKIAVLIGQLDQGGSERQLYMFLEHCDRERWEPLVYVSGELGFWEEPIRQLGIPVTLLRGNAISKMWRFRALCIANNVRCFFSWSSYTNGYGLALTGAGIASIGSFRNNHFADLPDRHRWLWSWMSVNGVSTVVCNSQETTDTLCRRIGHRKHVVYIPNSVQPVKNKEHKRKMWRECLDLQEHEVLVLGIGRLVPQKNFARFIEAVTIVNRTTPIRAVIAGKDGGCLESLQQYIRTSGLQPDVIRLIGVVPDARELMCAADILMLSSDYEGMPNVVLEAMAAGIPCVCTRINGVGELIQDGIHGFVTDQQASALAMRVQLLAQDEMLQQEMGMRAFERVNGSFEPEIVATLLWRLCDTRCS